MDAVESYMSRETDRCPATVGASQAAKQREEVTSCQTNTKEPAQCVAAAARIQRCGQVGCQAHNAVVTVGLSKIQRHFAQTKAAGGERSTKAERGGGSTKELETAGEE